MNSNSISTNICRLQAFALALQQLLQKQSAALQQLPLAASARRRAQASFSLSTEPGSEMCAASVVLPWGPGGMGLTLLEVMAHTAALRAQLALLEQLCNMSQRLPQGVPPVSP